jgi:hypothetical protein
VARFDNGHRIEAAGGAEVGMGGCCIWRGRSQIGDDPRQQRFERVGDEVEVRADLHRLLVVRRGTQWARAAHWPVSRIVPKPARLFSPIARPAPDRPPKSVCLTYNLAALFAAYRPKRRSPMPAAPGGADGMMESVESVMSKSIAAASDGPISLWPIPGTG